MADSVLQVSGPDPVNIDLITEKMSVLDINVINPDSAVMSEHHQISDTTFTFSFVPQKGASTVRFNLTDRFGNDTSASVTVIRSDRIRREIPLYREIIRPPQPPARSPAKQPPDTVREITDTLHAVSAPATSSAVTGKHEEKHCWLWWLLVPAALIIFFIIIRRKRKEKKNEKE